MFMIFRVITPYSIATVYRHFAIPSCFRPRSSVVTTSRTVASGKWVVCRIWCHNQEVRIVATLHQWPLRNVEDELHQSYLITYYFIAWKECKQYSGLESDVTAVRAWLTQLISRVMLDVWAKLTLRVHNRISAVVTMMQNCIYPWEFSLFLLSAKALFLNGMNVL